jgi:hypothetical protein
MERTLTRAELRNLFPKRCTELALREQTSVGYAQDTIRRWALSTVPDEQLSHAPRRLTGFIEIYTGKTVFAREETLCRIPDTRDGMQNWPH